MTKSARAVMALALGFLGACAMETPKNAPGEADTKADATMQAAADAAREICQAFADSQYQRSDEQRCTEDAFFASTSPEDCESQRTSCLAEPAPPSEPLDLVACTSELTKELMGCEATSLEVKSCARAAIASSLEVYAHVQCADVGSDSAVQATDELPAECEALHTRCPQLFENAVVEDGGFVCSDGHDIADEYVCDGFADCAGSEDESGCSPSEDAGVPGYDTDPDNLFRCDQGKEIPGDWVCDAYLDCEDQSDEANCDAEPPAGDGGFVCEDGFDVPDSAYCDGSADCSNGEDEVDCGQSDDAGVPEAPDAGDGADAGM